jgi:hypothetical protein
MQLMLDFFALEVVLAMWMISDGVERGAWGLAGVCVAAMPLFGAIPAAVYWLAR